MTFLLEGPPSVDFKHRNFESSFGYDPSARNLTQTNGNLITTDHFTDSSDSASFTTQKTLAGALQQTDLYIGAPGEGLNTTISVAATGSTTTTQIVDMNGSVVATIDIPTAGNATGPDSFQSFDEYGNPETQATPQTVTQTGLQNFGWAGTANRQTETTGLILMGARVYNPVTGQFTSPDPIPGGNENTYTYPNDPINANDFTGCWFWEKPSFLVSAILLPFSVAVVAGICGATGVFTLGLGCLATMAITGAVTSALQSSIEGREEGLPGEAFAKKVAFDTAIGAVTGVLGGASGRIATRLGRIFFQKTKFWKFTSTVTGPILGWSAKKIVKNIYTQATTPKNGR